MRDLTTLDTSPSARARRKEAAHRFLHERTRRGGPGAIIAKKLKSDDEEERRFARTILAGAAYRAERQWQERRART